MFKFLTPLTLRILRNPRRLLPSFPGSLQGLVASVVLVAFATAAFAQDSSGTTSTSSSSSSTASSSDSGASGSSSPTPELTSQAAAAADTLIKVVKAVVETVTEAFDELTKNQDLAAGGKTITYTLFAIVFAWNLLKSMVEGDGVNGLVAEMVPLMGTLAVVSALLDSGGVGMITSFMDSVASTFGASGGLGPDILAGAKSGFTSIANILSMPSLNTNVPWSEAIFNSLGIIVFFLVSMLAKLIAAILVTIAVGIYVANIVLAHGSIMLATALAPLMIPFILAPATSFIFDGWLRFTLGAAMIKVVGAFMIGFTDKLMVGMSKLSEKVALKGTEDFTTMSVTNLLVYCGLILLAGLSAYFMMQVPSLASGLLSGGSGGGFKGMKALTSGMGFQAAKSASLTSAGVAKNTASATVGAANSIRTGVAGVKANPMKSVSEKYGSVGGAAYRALGGKTR